MRGVNDTSGIVTTPCMAGDVNVQSGTSGDTYLQRFLSSLDRRHVQYYYSAPDLSFSRLFPSFYLPPRCPLPNSYENSPVRSTECSLCKT